MTPTRRFPCVSVPISTIYKASVVTLEPGSDDPAERTGFVVVEPSFMASLASGAAAAVGGGSGALGGSGTGGSGGGAGSGTTSSGGSGGQGGRGGVSSNEKKGGDGSENDELNGRDYCGALPKFTFILACKTCRLLRLDVHEGGSSSFATA
jgi:hypothetical protein